MRLNLKDLELEEGQIKLYKTIDLRLEGIGKGSTILYISGKTSPDLYGNSIIQDTLEDIFVFFSKAF